MSRHDSIFDRLQNQTNVNQDELYSIANSAEGADFQDEETVRQLTADVARMAGVRVSKEKEEQLVHAITNNQIPLDFASLNQMFKN